MGSCPEFIFNIKYNVIFMREFIEEFLPWWVLLAILIIIFVGNIAGCVQFLIDPLYMDLVEKYGNYVLSIYSQAISKYTFFTWIQLLIAIGIFIILFLLICILYEPKKPSILVIALMVERLFRFIYAIFIFLALLQFLTYIIIILIESRFFLTSDLWKIKIEGGMLMAIFMVYCLWFSSRWYKPIVINLKSSIFTPVYLFRLYFQWLFKAKSEKFTCPPIVNNYTTDYTNSTLLLVSDIHATDIGIKTLEGNITDDLAYNFISDMLEGIKPNAIILTGDITDDGAHKAWSKVADTLNRYDNIPVYIVPGNHDIHFKRVAYPKYDFLNCLLEIESLNNTGSSFKPEDFFNQSQKIKGCNKLFSYPEVFYIESLNLDVLLLNSNQRISNSPVTNAIGYIGHDQLIKAKKLLDNRNKAASLIIALHHHIIPTSWNFFTTCMDAVEVLRLAELHGAEAILHGHLHMPYVYDHEYNNGSNNNTIQIISCGSSLYSAAGIFADKVKGPSAFLLSRVNGRWQAVSLLCATQ